MKKTIFAVVTTLFAASLCANQAAAPASAAKPVAAEAQTAATAAKIDAKVEEKAIAQNDQMMMGGGCENMSADQKNFAMQLNASNKSMFCNQFTPAQRSNAMQMSGTMNNGVRMTPDMAVEQVARGGNMSGTKNPGGCPVSPAR